jgi:hypothetical protein
MTLTEIYTAVYAKIAATASLPTKIYENVKPPAETPSEYLEIFIMPLPNENQAFSYVERKAGLIQINVVVELQKRSIRPAQIADLILAAFKNGTVISSGLKVSRPSYSSAGIKDENRYIIPITIQYENIST